MCMPLGPRHSACYGRRAFWTIEDAKRYSIEAARKKYNDNAEAMQILLRYTEENKEHTLNWMVDDLFDTDRQLLRIAVEDENLTVWRRELRKLKATG